MGKTKILMVDDRRENLLALGKLLENDELELFSALDAEEALNLILDHDFALGLFDVQMPGTTGFELARLIRGIERSRHLPIIFVTAELGESAAVFEGYESGAVDFLLKPLDPAIVRSKVRVFVELDQQRKTLRAQFDQMNLLKEAAEAASIAKSRFLAAMSHEIRTPMAAVIGFADLILESSTIAPEIRTFSTRIKNNGAQLLKLIDDILDISKIEAGKLGVTKEAVDVATLVRDVMASLEVLARNKGLRFELKVDDGIPSPLAIDPSHLRQSLLNVVGNAIKFTVEGSVKVHARYEGTRERGTLVIDVTDTGIGISEEARGRLFQPFAREDYKANRRFGGTGLGLLLAKRLMEALHGDLTILQTTPGLGSTFRLSLPVAPSEVRKLSESSPTTPPAEVKPRDPSEKPLEGLSILLVEDVLDNQLLFQAFFDTVGARLDVAKNGVEGVEMAKSGNYDVVLMDVQMPIMDGLTATRTLREQGYRKPIFALTAHALKEEVQRSFDAGCNDHISKPADWQLLIDKLIPLRPDARAPNASSPNA